MSDVTLTTELHSLVVGVGVEGFEPRMDQDPKPVALPWPFIPTGLSQKRLH